jgi:hypothetical protein
LKGEIAMTLEWTTINIVEFPEDEIEAICQAIRNNDYSVSNIRDLVTDVVEGFEDCDYYVWGEDQTQEVIKEIQSRIGGVQLSMFDELE